MTSNCQRSLHHVVSIYHNDRTNLRSLAPKSNSQMAVKDKKEISFEREASIAEIHQLPFDARISAIAEIENFSASNARIAGNTTIAGKLNKTVSISTQRSLVTKLCDPCVTRDPCDHMETKLLENQALKAYIFTSIYDLSTRPRGKSLIFFVHLP